MMHRKRKYLDGDYGRSRWSRGKPVYQVAVAVEPTDDGAVRLAFHVPHPRLVTEVMDRLQGTLFEGYAISEDICPAMLNGKCYRSWVVTVRQPDLHRLSLAEWLPMVKSMMERRFNCQVTCFESYERFLNA
jgi:hypothetical protein